MKNFVASMTVYILMIAAVAADEFYGIEYAGNLAGFAVWFLIICGFIALFAEPKDLFVRNPYMRLPQMIIRYALICLLVAVGWTGSGLFFFLVSLCLDIKYSTYKDELAKKSAV